MTPLHWPHIYQRWARGETISKEEIDFLIAVSSLMFSGGHAGCTSFWRPSDELMSEEYPRCA